MSKIVAFLGSPRKNGYTAKLINRILDGAKSEGAEVIVYDLNAEGIKGCQAASTAATMRTAQPKMPYIRCMKILNQPMELFLVRRFISVRSADR